jgi:hypothetical protein
MRKARTALNARSNASDADSASGSWPSLSIRPTRRR